MYRPLKHEIVSILVDNQPNVLTRVISMYGRRGFNIDSLTVSATNNPKYSRITIAFEATETTMQQIITQTMKLEVVKDVSLMTQNDAIYRELLMVRVKSNPDIRGSIKEIVDIFRGKIIDLSKDSMVIELTGTPEKLDGFIDVMEDFDIVDLCRTGITGIEGTNQKRGEGND